jgi:CubicO group peptidase (beta-lactamase class C family)
MEALERTVLASDLKQKLSPGAGAVVAFLGTKTLNTFAVGTGVMEKMPMEVGSATKVFTALLVADAILRGEIQLPTRVDELLFGERWAGAPAITVGHLVSHTSGLPRLSMPAKDILLDPQDPYRTYTRQHLLDTLSRQEPRVPETLKFSYSNFGYAVLGLMLERATSRTYNELLVERLLAPLDMLESGLHLAGRPDRASPGFSANGDLTSVWHQDGYAPCGALVSTLNDMARAVQAFLDPSSCVAQALDVTLQPRMAISGGHVGFAWMIPEGSDWSWHNGATFGYTSYLGINRSQGMGIVILCNQFRANETTELGHRLMRMGSGNRKDDHDDAG